MRNNLEIHAAHPNTQLAKERPRNKPVKRQADCRTAAFDHLMRHQRNNQIPVNAIAKTKHVTAAPCDPYSTYFPPALNFSARAAWQTSDQNCRTVTIAKPGFNT
jgi:hypothetical protein